MVDDGKQNVLGIQISAIDYAAATMKIIEAAKMRQPMAVSALAVHGLMSGVLDPELKFRLNRFDLLCPDGQPVRWAVNWMGSTKLAERVYGPFLTLHVCEAAAREGLGIFLFGSSAAVLARLEASLVAKFPKLIIAGKQPSRFRKASAAEVARDVETVRASGAAIVLAGLGCPRQEIWAFEMRERLSVPILAVGAAFDFHAGSLAMAPPWMQRSGLEWAFRLWQEPGRLWRRYLYLNPLYVGGLLLQGLGLKRFDPEAGRPPARPLQFG
jgi:exopolysaccharide biosynthesis WecB/TagA/CpsF family protein